MTLTTDRGHLSSCHGGIFPQMEPLIARECEKVRADRDRAFMREARGWALNRQPGSVEHLRRLLAQYRAAQSMRRSDNYRLMRILIVAEIIKVKRGRLAVEATQLLAAE